MYVLMIKVQKQFYFFSCCDEKKMIKANIKEFLYAYSKFQLVYVRNIIHTKLLILKIVYKPPTLCLRQFGILCIRIIYFNLLLITEQQLKLKNKTKYLGTFQQCHTEWKSRIICLSKRYIRFTIQISKIIRVPRNLCRKIYHELLCLRIFSKTIILTQNKRRSSIILENIINVFFKEYLLTNNY